MPQLGETVVEGTITRWHKRPGDSVLEDEPLFDVSTDKIDTEVGAPASGTLTEIIVGEGQTVDVGTLLARIGDAGEPVAAPATAPTAARDAEPARDAAPVTAAVTAPPGPRDAAPASAPDAAPADGSTGRRHLFSPSVRRLLDVSGLDPRSITGTGRGGRVTRRDVERALMSAPAAPARPAPRVDVPETRHTVVPFSGIRRRTAEHMIRSRATSAHALVSIELDYENVDAVRAGAGLTYLPFLARAVVEALTAFPHLNASVGDDELIVHHDINLGIAVDLDFDGLVVPVVHEADALRLRALGRRIAERAEAARAKRLRPDDLAGGTFTITNVGSYGTMLSIPIINQPQVAILSTDGIKRKPVVVEMADGSEAIAIHPVGNIALSWDHRAVDGAYAAAFVHRVKQVIETTDWTAELA